MKKLSINPKNPRHFVALCFLEMRSFPELKESHQYMKLVKEEPHRALFECAYGFFWADKSQRRYSQAFYKSKESAIEITKPLDLPEGLLEEWVWEVP